MKKANVFLTIVMILSLALQGCGPKAGPLVETPQENQMEDQSVVEVDDEEESEVVVDTTEVDKDAVLYVEPGKIEFGTVEPNASLDGKLQLINKTDNYIKITNIATGCGCTLVDKKLVGKVFAPGHSEELKFRYKTKPVPGKATKYVTVQTAIVTGTDTEVISVDVEHNSASTTNAKAQLVNGYLRITNLIDDTLVVANIQPGKGGTIKDPKQIGTVIAPKASVSILFNYDTPEAKAAPSSKITLETHKLGKIYSTRVPYIATIKKVLDYSPTNLRFEIRQSENNKVNVTIKSTDENKFRITNFQCKPNAIAAKADSPASKTVTCEYDKSARAIEHVVTLTANPDLLRANTSGLVSFDIDHPKIKIVSIPFYSTTPFNAQPSTKMITGYIEKESKPFKIKIISSFKEDFELAGITSKQDRINVLGQTKTIDGYEIEATLTVPDNYSSTRIGDTMVVELKDHPDDQQSVYIWGKIKK
ncbi:MAG: DUF1573 domain-containing protein [Phycisphaerae bacterium]|nr:DUF1573 domain-containing protein [Phycisphaerae bacterium]